MIAKAKVEASASAFAVALLQSEASHGRKVNKLQLQKLLYLADAASVALWGRPAFREPVVAFPYGPAVSQVANDYKGIANPTTNVIEQVPENDPGLGPEDRATVGWVLERFGGWSATRLINFVKRDGNPWQHVFDADGPGPQSVISLQDTVAWFTQAGLDPSSADEHALALQMEANKIATAHAAALDKLGR